MVNEYGNYAFISYSHADESWAKWVQRRLETYRFPSELRKKNRDLPKKIFPIFRDQTDLSGINLWDAIRHQLEDSKYLIVISSPRSAKSQFVEKEVEYFKSLGRTDRIIPVIIDGIPHAQDPKDECFCPVLLNVEDDLLGVDVKVLGRAKSVLRIVATMTELRFDTLVRRDRIRQAKRTAFGIAGAVLVALAIILSFRLSKYPEQSAAYAANAFAAIEQNNIDQAVQNGKTSVRLLLQKTPDDDGVVALRSALVLKEFSDSNEAIHETFSVKLPVQDLLFLGMLEDQQTMLFTDHSFAYVYDGTTGELLKTYSFPQDENSTEQKMLAAINEETLLYNSRSTKDGNGVILSKKSASQKHQLRIEDGRLTIEDETGKIVKTYENIAENGLRYGFNRDETVLAFFDEQSGLLRVDNLGTDSVLLHLDNTAPEAVASLKLSPEGNLLLLENNNHFLNVVDLSRLLLVKSIEIGDRLFDGVIMEDSFSGYFYILTSGMMTRMAYQGKTPQGGQDPEAYRGSGIDEQISSDNEVFMQKTEIVLNEEEYQSEYYWTWTDIETGKLLFTAHRDEAFPFFSIDDKMKTLVTDSGEIWSIREGKKLYTDSAAFRMRVVNEDGSQAASVDDDGNVFLYDITETGNVSKHHFLSLKDVLPEFDVDNPCTFIAFSDEEFIVCASDAASTVVRFRLTDGSKTGEEKVPWAFSFDYIKDGLLFTQDTEGASTVYDLSKHEKISDMYVDPAYSDKTHLYCGSEYTNQMFANTEYSVFEWKNGEMVLLYKYKAAGEADPQFSDDGEYLILNIKDFEDDIYRSAVVLQARTGEVLLKLPDCHVAIRNGIIYNISPDYVPIPLPTAKMYSLDELVQIAKEK